MVFMYQKDNAIVVCDPLLLIRAVCKDSLVMCWYSLLTGELVDATLQSWN